MPWMETSSMNERIRFIEWSMSGNWEMKELCEHFGISRKTGYKWKNRYLEEGLSGLEERSRAPRSCPHRTPAQVVELVLQTKRKYPSWGARKVLAHLQKKTDAQLPVESTVNELFDREGLVKKRRKRQSVLHRGKPFIEAEQPNEVWTADFKGQFRMGNGVYNYPLTIGDLASRFVLECRGQESVRVDETIPNFKRVFLEHGLPDVLVTDNGVPFCAPSSYLGLTRLNVWWISLGIKHVRTQPGCPQQNGVHERMHKTLKEEATKPAAYSFGAQQRRFNEWRRIYNEERPHESLDYSVPAMHYRPSTRPYPKRIPPPEYPEHFTVRQVCGAGFFRYKNVPCFLSKHLNGYHVGLEPFDDGVWSIYFYDQLLARMNERDGSIN